MSGYRLERRATLPGLVDASPLCADRLAVLDENAVARLELLAGAERVPLGDLFRVRRLAEHGTPRLEIEGSPHLLRLAAGMEAGRVDVDGDAGGLLGEGLRGGEIHVRGDAGPLAGASARGGVISITGSAGDRLGGPSPGAKHGLAGAEIIVAKDAGEEAGLRMRRGLIAVGGEVGRLPAHHGLAGTLLVARGPLELAGLGMRRTSIVSLDREAYPESLRTANFVESGAAQPIILRVLYARLRALGVDLDTACDFASYHLFSGDILEGGRGEILVAAG